MVYQRNDQQKEHNVATEHLVFVYGTLRRGYGNHRLLSGARVVGDGTTMDTFVMFDGGFPRAATLAHASKARRHGRERTMPLAGRVVGELYAVDDATLARLDALEGTPRLYRRETVRVKVGGIESNVSMYLIQPEHAGGHVIQPDAHGRVEWVSLMDREMNYA